MRGIYLNVRLAATANNSERDAGIYYASQVPKPADG